MSNILAIAQKELKSYFSSPIAYIVIGVFALLLYGFFYFVMLQYFMRSAWKWLGPEPTAIRSTSTRSCFA